MKFTISTKKIEALKWIKNKYFKKLNAKNPIHQSKSKRFPKNIFKFGFLPHKNISLIDVGRNANSKIPK